MGQHFNALFHQQGSRHSFPFYAILFHRGSGMEVRLGEKGIEQGNARERSGMVECHERAGKTESRQHMPQVKWLKKLTLPVGSKKEVGAEGSIRKCRTCRLIRMPDYRGLYQF
jgi:hypothetical protein